MKLTRALLLVSATGVLLSASSAWAQAPIDDNLDARSAKRLDQMEKVVKELRAIVFQGRDSGAPIVVQPADTDSRINALTDRLNDLDRTLAHLNGQVEEIRHDLDETRKQNVDLTAQNTALQARLTADELQLKASSSTAGAEATASPNAPQQDVSPAAAFAAARSRFALGDTAAAEAQFHDFVDRFGDTSLAPEAHYYLARTLIDRRAWAEAASADIAAIRGWPQTPWAPRAVLDLTRSLHALGKDPDACQTLGEFARRYPRAPGEVKSQAASLRHDAQCG